MSHKCECGREIKLSAAERKLMESVPSFREKFASGGFTRDSINKFHLVLSRLVAEMFNE